MTVTKRQYVESSDHYQLALDHDMTLLELTALAEENSWAEEHEAYWQQRTLCVLKQHVAEGRLNAAKELAKVLGMTKPVGRPPKEKESVSEEFPEVERMRAVDFG